jgi:hypothetical protein
MRYGHEISERGSRVILRQRKATEGEGDNSQIVCMAPFIAKSILQPSRALFGISKAGSIGSMASRCGRGTDFR